MAYSWYPSGERLKMFQKLMDKKFRYLHSHKLKNNMNSSEKWNGKGTSLLAVQMRTHLRTSSTLASTN